MGQYESSQRVIFRNGSPDQGAAGYGAKTNVSKRSDYSVADSYQARNSLWCTLRESIRAARPKS